MRKLTIAMVACLVLSACGSTDDSTTEGGATAETAQSSPTTSEVTAALAFANEPAPEAEVVSLGDLLEKTRWAIVRTEGLGTGQVDNDLSWISFWTGEEFGLTWGGGNNGCNGFAAEIKWTDEGYEVPMIATETDPQIVGIITNVGCPENSRVFKLFERGRRVTVDVSDDRIVLTEGSRLVEGVRVPFELDN